MVKAQEDIGGFNVQTRQKVVLLTLVVLSLAQQGWKWRVSQTNTGGVENHFAVATVQAAEHRSEEPRNAHCPLVHVNTAGLAELQTLPGIGPVYAERIMIERREQPFKEKHELLRVSGIGEKRLSQLIDLICLYLEDDASE